MLSVLEISRMHCPSCSGYSRSSSARVGTLGPDFPPYRLADLQPSYSNFSRWYVIWLLISAVYHLPNLQAMGIDIKMNLYLFLTLFLSSVLALVVFHITFICLWYMGIVARVAGKRPEILTILQNNVVLSIACCVFYNHCGNRASLRSKWFGRRHSGRLVVDSLNKPNDATWYFGLTHMHELKEKVFSTWFAPVGSASDYPIFSKWVIYGEKRLNLQKINPPEIPIVPQFVSLTEEQQTLLSKEAITCIIETYRQADGAGGRDLRCSLLARLIA